MVTKPGAAMMGAVMLVGAAIGLMPMADAHHQDGHTVVVNEAGIKIELRRLEPRIPVVVNNAPTVVTPAEVLGYVAAITVTIEDVQGADNTTFTTAAFGFNDPCDIVITLPLVRECKVVPGTSQAVTAPDPAVVSQALQKCIYGQRITVNIGPFKPFFSTGELLEPVDGPCPA